MSLLGNIEFHPNLLELTRHLCETGDLTLFEKYIGSLPETTEKLADYVCELVVIGKFSRYTTVQFYFTPRHAFTINDTRILFTLQLQKTHFSITNDYISSSAVKKIMATKWFKKRYKVYTIPPHSDNLYSLLLTLRMLQQKNDSGVIKYLELRCI